MNKVRGALIKVSPIRRISDTFSVQEVYLDTSTYNNSTGERYDNMMKLQVANGRVNMEQFRRGQLLEVQFYINGRTYKRQDGTYGFAQNVNMFSADLVRNTSGDVLIVPDDQLLNVLFD